MRMTLRSPLPLTLLLLLIALILTTARAIPLSTRIETLRVPSAVNRGQSATLSWYYADGQVGDITRGFQLIARPALLDEYEASYCPQTREEKVLARSQVILPSIQLWSASYSNDYKFTWPDLAFSSFCLYGQQDGDIEGEVTATTSSGETVYAPRSAGTFCLSSCRATRTYDLTAAVGCDAVNQQCLCPLHDGKNYTSFECVDTAAYAASTAVKCYPYGTDVYTTTQTNMFVTNPDNYKCICRGYYSGPQCNVCSLSLCTEWDSKTKSCSTCQNGSVPDATCSKCMCTSNFYRGTTCACRSAIFTIAFHPTIRFQLPYPDVVMDMDHLQAPGPLLLTPAQNEARVTNLLFLQRLRLALAVDLNVPLLGIEIVSFDNTHLRIAVTPFCSSFLPKPWEVNTVENDRTYFDEYAFEMLSTSQQNDEVVVDQDFARGPQNAEQVEIHNKIQSLKTAYTTRYNRGPLEHKQKQQQQQQELATDPMTVQSNRFDEPFVEIFDNLQAAYHTTADARHTSAFGHLLVDVFNATNNNTLAPTAMTMLSTTGQDNILLNEPFAATQIYFPNCASSEICSQLGPNPWAEAESDHNVVIIVIVIICVMVLAGIISIAGLLYCKHNMLCCFRAVEDYKERKREEERERRRRVSSTSNTDYSTTSGGSSGGSSGRSSGSRPARDASQTPAGRQSISGTSSGRTSGARSSATPPGRKRSNSRPRNSQSGTELGAPRPSMNTSRGHTPAGQRHGGGGAGAMRSPITSTNQHTMIRQSTVRPADSPMSPGRTLGGIPAPLEDDEDDVLLPPGWEKAQAPDGKIMYINTKTMASQWHHPGKILEEEDDDW